MNLCETDEYKKKHKDNHPKPKAEKKSSDK